MGEVLTQGGRDEQLLLATLTRAALHSARTSSQLPDRRTDLG